MGYINIGKPTDIQIVMAFAAKITWGPYGIGILGWNATVYKEPNTHL